MVGFHKAHNTQGQLTAKGRRRENVAGNNKPCINIRVQIYVEVDVHRRAESPDGDFARSSDGTASSHGVIVIGDRKRPTRLLRNRRETTEQTGKPEADAVFICVRGRGCRGRQADRNRSAHPGQPKLRRS
jgi:hypothetical protein